MSVVINSDGEILVALAASQFRTVAGDDTLTEADLGGVVLVSAPATLTLPSVVGLRAGLTITIKSLTSAGSVFVVPNGSELIDGDPSKEMLFQYSSMSILSDGSEWRVV